MLEQLEGAAAVAAVLALCRPQVVAAHPIAPHSRVFEELRERAVAGRLAGCEVIDAGCALAALSLAVGACAAGARSLTLASGRELLEIAEAAYQAAALGLPVVMTVANRAAGAGGIVRNDHSDSMALRDSGWIQLHAETSQHAVDLHMVAIRLGEELGCPVMVCMDALALTRAWERVEVPTQAQVDVFLPRPRHHAMLDPAQPVTLGAIPGPDAFMEASYLAHHRQLRALQLIPQLAAAFRQQFGRDPGGLVHTYRIEDAETVVVTLGSLSGTVREVLDAMRTQGTRIGGLAIVSFRPFPTAVLRESLQAARRVVVLEKCLAAGLGGIVSEGLRKALVDTTTRTYTVIAGLGGRDIGRDSLLQLFEDAGNDELEQVTFLDLNADLVAHELERESRARRSERIPDAILRRLPSVDAGLR